MPTKEERLDAFRLRWAAELPARSFDEAYGQLCRLLNEVEDSLSNRPFNLTVAPSDGRLYPPLWDNISLDPSRPRVRRLRSARHVTFIGDNGSVEIYDIPSRTTIFVKPGFDGLRADQL